MIRQFFIAIALFVVVAHGTIPHGTSTNEECCFSATENSSDLWDALSEPMRVLPEEQHPGLCVHEESSELTAIQLITLIHIALPSFYLFEDVSNEFPELVFLVDDDQAFGKWRNRPPPALV